MTLKLRVENKPKISYESLESELWEVTSTKLLLNSLVLSSTSIGVCGSECSLCSLELESDSCTTGDSDSEASGSSSLLSVVDMLSSFVTSSDSCASATTLSSLVLGSLGISSVEDVIESLSSVSVSAVSFTVSVSESAGTFKSVLEISSVSVVIVAGSLVSFVHSGVTSSTGMPSASAELSLGSTAFVSGVAATFSSSSLSSSLVGSGFASSFSDSCGKVEDVESAFSTVC